MLSAKRRLRSSEVAEVIRRGTSVRGEFVSLKALRGGSGMRAAAVIGKSLAKKAVARNSARRALYGALAGLPVHPNAKIVFFIVKIPPAPLQTNFRTDIDKSFKKLQ